MYNMHIINRLKPSHLKLIVKISKTKKLKNAVDFLGMSQPAGSRILSEIENELGFDLFERTSKGMEPTKLGIIFLRHAHVILAEFKSLEKEVLALKNGTAGELSVGSVTGPAVAYLMPAIRNLDQSIEISVEIAPSKTLLKNLDDGFLDFIIGRIPEGLNTKAYKTHPISTEIVKLVASNLHPLADVKNVSLETLKSYPWVIQEIGNPIRKAVEDLFLINSSNLPPHIINSSSLLVALSQIANSEAIAPQTKEVFDLLKHEKIATEFTSIDLLEEIIVPIYFIIYPSKKNLSNIAKRLLEDILQMASERSVGSD